MPSATVLLLVLGIPPVLSFAVNLPTSLFGRTPCCVDRLSSTTCTRIRTANPLNFDKRCQQDADFSLVQCCSSCFPRKHGNSSLRYADTVLRLVQSPLKSSCWDRRGSHWCSKLVTKTGFWESPRFAQVGCNTFPFAFRECRQSCGYCSTGHIITRLLYDHKVATDTRLCDSKTYFARTEEEVLIEKKKRVTDFDPLALLKIANKKPDDYFVVVDHNYDVPDSKEKSAEKQNLNELRI